MARKKAIDKAQMLDSLRATRKEQSKANTDVEQTSEETAEETFQDINYLQDGVEDREGEEDKENEVARPRRMIDAHPSSKKIPWEDEDEEEDDFDQPKQPPRARRTRQIRDESEAGPVARSPLPRAKPQGSRKIPSSAPLPSSAPTPAQRLTSHSRQDAPSSEEPLQHQTEPEMQEEDELPTSTFQRRQMVQQLSIANARVVQRKIQGSRQPFTVEQEACLEDLIGQYGASYTVLLARDAADQGLLQEKSQVQLKDKAMDMKFQYLKSGLPLPTNFESVPLRQRMKDKLVEMGIDPEAQNGQEEM